MGLGDRLSHYPAQLSGGEQQRVALARALCPRPSLLIADEPTGNLDETTGSAIVDLIFDLPARRGATLALVTHDAALAARCDRVIRMRSGKVEETPGRRLRMNAPAAFPQVRGRTPMARFAIRDLRGGLARPAHLSSLHRARREPRSSGSKVSPARSTMVSGAKDA